MAQKRIGEFACLVGGGRGGGLHRLNRQEFSSWARKGKTGFSNERSCKLRLSVEDGYATLNISKPDAKKFFPITIGIRQSQCFPIAWRLIRRDVSDSSIEGKVPNVHCRVRLGPHAQTVQCVPRLDNARNQHLALAPADTETKNYPLRLFTQGLLLGLALLQAASDSTERVIEPSEFESLSNSQLKARAMNLVRSISPSDELVEMLSSQLGSNELAIDLKMKEIRLRRLQRRMGKN